MFFAIGSSGDKTMAHFVGTARNQGADFDFLDIKDIVEAQALEVSASSAGLTIVADGRLYDFNDYSAFYTRAMFPQTDLGRRHRKMAIFMDELLGFLSSTKLLVVNRPFSGIENSSKLAQIQSLRKVGFTVPETIVTSDSGAAQRLIRPDGNWISKGCSGVRTIAAAVDKAMYSHLSELREVPVLLQRRIIGHDVRMHYICGELIALRICSSEVDYRYADDELNVTIEQDIPYLVQHAARYYCAASGLQFSGFDFKVDAKTGDWYVLEANPMPGYDFFDKWADGAITSAIVRALVNAPGDRPIGEAAPEDKAYIPLSRRPSVRAF